MATHDTKSTRNGGQGSQPTLQKKESGDRSPVASAVGAVEGYSAQQLMLKPSADGGGMGGLSTGMQAALAQLPPDEQAEVASLDPEDLAEVADMDPREQDQLVGATEPLDRVQTKTSRSDATVQKKSSPRVQTKATTVKAGKTKEPSLKYSKPSKGSDAETAVATFKKQVSEAKYTEAFTTLMGETDQVAGVGWRGLTVTERRSMANGLARGGDTETTKGQKILKIFVFTQPGLDEITPLTKLFEIRFNLSVGQTLSARKTGVDWEPRGLKRCWAILELLPPNHVENNTWLDAWTRYESSSSGSGYYSASRKESSLGYDPGKLDNANTSAQEGDPLLGVTRFNKVVRHEVGHAVDKKIGAKASYCLGNAKGGDWREWSPPTQGLVTEMVDGSAGAISGLDAGKRDLVEKALLKSMTDKKPEDVDANLGTCGLTATELREAKADTAAKTAKLSGYDKNPWYNNDSLGINIGGRHYQATGYGSSWNSYSRGKLSSKVSTYQYRAPGEWFAEAYATYYQPDTDGKVGTLLEQRDKETKEWFDANVHTA